MSELDIAAGEQLFWRTKMEVAKEVRVVQIIFRTSRGA
jgi:hypothetical protein